MSFSTAMSRSRLSGRGAPMTSTVPAVGGGTGTWPAPHAATLTTPSRSTAADSRRIS
jgi:hypothetical protein